MKKGVDFGKAFRYKYASVARKVQLQLSGNNSVVECNLAKVEVAGSNPVSRSSLKAPQTEMVCGAFCCLSAGIAKGSS